MKTAGSADRFEAGEGGCFQAPGHRPGAWTVHQDHRQELRRLQPPNLRRIAIEGVVLVAIGTGVGLIAAPFSLSFPAAALSLIFGAIGLYARHRDNEKIEDNEEVMSLRDEFGVGPVWTIDLMIRQGEAPTGRDQGLIWIEGGRILFSGQRTSFALSPAQADGSIYHELAVRDLRLRLNLSLHARTAAGPVSLSFWPIADGFRRAEEDASEMRYALNSILDGGRWTAKAPVEGQWPPFEVGPGALAPGLARRTLLRQTGLWVGGAFLFSLPLAFAYPLLGIAEFGVLVIIAYVINRGELKRRRQAYRDAKAAWLN